MPVRHFKRKYSTHEDSSSSDSSSGEENDTNLAPSLNTSKASGANGAHEQESERSDSNNRSHSSDSESSDSGSDEEDVIPLHRPVFINKSERVKRPSEDDTQQIQAERETKRHLTLVQKVERENEILSAQDESKRQLEMNYSTDKDILRQAMLLDDNDATDPEGEKQAWLERQEIRKKQRRDKLIAKQLELEEYEANKLRFSKTPDLADINEGSEERIKSKFKPSAESTEKYKPSRPQNTRLRSSSKQEDQAAENEYSIL